MSRKYDVAWISQFKKLQIWPGKNLNIEIRAKLIRNLSRGEALPQDNRDLALSGNWSGYREGHVQPDWLLIFRIEEELPINTDSDQNRLSL